MSDLVMTCVRVEDEDLDTRYLAGRLSEPEATAFEEHYFGCERCWALVQQGLALQGAMAGTAPSSVRHARRSWWGLAAAGALAAGIGLWLVVARPIEPPADSIRGRASITVRAATDGRAASAVWAPVAGADIYHVRLFAADGALLYQRRLADTAIAIPLDSTPSATGGAFWDVEALDRMRDPVGRSELTRAALPPSPP
jgi:anti-sigma factor RsiW